MLKRAPTKLSRLSGPRAPAALLALASLLTAASACHTTRACRRGTIFLTVDFGAFTGADHLTVAVAVANSPARTPVPFPLTGAPRGSVEISFPSGYPAAGEAVTVVATLVAVSGTTLASKTALTSLDPVCTALQIDFAAPADASSGDADGRGDAAAEVDAGGGGGGGGAAGGTASGGGAGGTSLIGGAGGTPGGTAGRGGVGGAASTAGASGSAGRGAGMAGATGMAGRGGAAGGSAGRGGSSGSGGGGGGATGGAAGSTVRPCVPTGPESCYNNLDDDCNGLIDCADIAACTPVAQCQPLDPSMGMIGASVPSTDVCPTGAPTSRAIMTGLTAAGCTGCACAAGSAGLTCRADIYGYYDVASPMCAANTGGQLVTTLTSAQICFTPNWSGGLFVTGVRASAFAATPSGTCLPTGTATRGTPVWSTNYKFCGATSVGGGCAAGFACIPRTIVAAGACMLLDGARTCPAATPRVSSWFTGVADTRTCGACACGAPAGGNCAPMIIAVGNDYSCSDPLNGYVLSGNRLCIAGNGGYSPGLQFTGTPVPPTCAPSAGFSGTLTATGQLTLCCL